MNRTNVQALSDRILNVPLVLWVLLGLAVPYLMFFISPIFFSGEPKMQFPEYVPAVAPIGTDMYTIIDTAYAWVTTQKDPYANNGQYAYPPLNMLIVLPLSLFSKVVAYKIITLVNVLGVVVIALLVPLRLSRPRPVSALLPLTLLTGLFAYGFQFELERGQMNVIAMGLTMVAIWLYHDHPRWRYLAYGLFTAGVQLKVFPFIFILLLIHDWRDWKNNLKRFALLGAVNFAALFVFGPGLFLRWLAALVDKALNPYLWFGNHSIRSFSTWIPTKPGWEWLAPYSIPVTIVLMAVVAVCLGLLLVQAHRRRQAGVSPILLLACTIAALTLPSDSHDYTLSFLVAPVALMFAQPDTWSTARTRGRRASVLGLLGIFSGAYGFTLFSFSNKPLHLFNDCIPLLLMLLTGTVLAFVSESTPAVQAADTPSPA